VICFDEFGPLEIRPQLGENWRKEPDKIPATYYRDKGIRCLFVALDLKKNKMYAHMKKRKRSNDFLAFLKYIRSLFKEKIFIILDNLSSHKTKKVKEWCEKNDIELVFTPTNASWLNRIECHLTALKKFTIRNSNYKDFKEMGSAIRKYIRWRNKNYEKYEIKKIENKHNFL